MSPVVNELAVTRQSSRTSTSDRTVGSSDRDHVNEKAANLELAGADEEDKEAIKLQDSEDVVNGPPAGEQARPIIPWKYKLLAWTCIVFWGTGSWMGEQALGPLKATMKRELNITSELYHALPVASHHSSKNVRCSIRRHLVFQLLHQLGSSHHWRYRYGPFWCWQVSI